MESKQARDKVRHSSLIHLLSSAVFCAHSGVVVVVLPALTRFVLCRCHSQFDEDENLDEYDTSIAPSHEEDQNEYERMQAVQAAAARPEVSKRKPTAADALAELVDDNADVSVLLCSTCASYVRFLSTIVRACRAAGSLYLSIMRASALAFVGLAVFAISFDNIYASMTVSAP